MRNLEGVEKARQVEQERLDRLKGLRERNQLGQFATSSPLALDIARFVASLWGDRPEPVNFFEPALGTGAFYSALRRIFPAQQIRSAVGVEVDPLFAEAAGTLWRGTGLKVVNADFTTLDPPHPSCCHNLVLTNPPYVRHHHLGLEDKARLKAAVFDHLGIGISGLAGLYCHFLLLCDRWLADGGLAAWLIPSEFMEVNYGAAVKEYLAEKVSLRRIHRFCPSDIQFCDALVTSAVVVFEKAKPNAYHDVEMSFGGSILSPTTCQAIPLSTLRAAKKWTAFPSTGEVAQRHAATMGSFFEIKRGIATGANSFFILERVEAIRRGIPEQFLRPILPGSRYLKEEVIEPNGEGYPKLERPLAIIDCDLPEETIRERFPAFWEYLAEGKRQEVHTGYLASRRSPWYSQESRPPAPFLCTYMGRKKADGGPFRFFWNKTDAIAANVFLLLYPTGALKKALKTRHELYPAVFDFLRSINPDHLIGEGRVYGGGLHKMEPKELAGLPAGPLAEMIDEEPRPARQATLFF